MSGQRSCDPLLESDTPAGSFRKRRRSVRTKAYPRCASAVRWKRAFEAMEHPSHPKKLKRTHTAVIFACIFALGLISAIQGGTLDDLGDIYHLTSTGVSQILVTRSAGILIGSLLCGGFLYKHVNAKIVIIVSLMFGGLGTAIMPDVAPHFWIAHAGIFVSGFSVGALEVGANVWLVQLWEDGVDPIMQSYHVSYGVGALLAPLVTTPFLGPEKNKTLNATMEERFEVFELDPEAPTNGTSHIAVPYGLFGGIYSFMGLVILFFFIIDRTVLRQHPAPATDESNRGSVARFEWTVVALLSTYIIICVTAESIMANMLVLYVNRNPDLNMDKAEGNYLLALYWATYTTGRIASIFVSFKLRPNTILIIAQTIAALGAGVLFLLVFPATAGRETVWIATGILGFGLAPLYPTAFTWAVRYIHLKYVHVSVILVASCTGGFLPTYLVAPWVDSSKTAMPWVALICDMLLVCVLALMLFTSRNRSPIYEQDSERNLIARVKERDSEYTNDYFSESNRL